MNRAKNSRAVPRSRSATMMTTGDAPGQEHRTEVLRVGEERPALGPRGQGQQLALLDQVGGEEHGQGELGELAGLEVHRPEADPDAGAVDVLPEHRDQREQHQADADEQGDVAVALEVAGPTDEGEGGDEGARCPTAVHSDLQAGQVLVEAGDEHVAQPVEQDGQREEGAVGPGRQLPHGEVRGEEQGQEQAEERPDVRPAPTRCCPGWPGRRRRRSRPRR